jgi:hypothetical protein
MHPDRTQMDSFTSTQSPGYHRCTIQRPTVKACPCKIPCSRCIHQYYDRTLHYSYCIVDPKVRRYTTAEDRNSVLRKGCMSNNDKNAGA